ncbi:hypothetical protein JA1_002248 [Spathaspora sp. JA1]|nr:hypothetical protein JA1_002248 [Spathaspora sp. JA1]
MNLILITLVLFINHAWCAFYTNKTRSSLAASKCSGADEVQRDVFFGYISGAKTEDNKQLALKFIENYKLQLYENPNQSSFRYRTDDGVYAYMWVGSMIQNAGFSTSNAFQVIYDEVTKNGIPKQIYIEYVNGDPMQGFGLIIDTTNDFSKVQKAVRAWSMGKKIGGHTGSKNYPGKSMCYLSYANRKPILQDDHAGDCEYFRVISGENVEVTSGINSIVLQGYNPSIDFGVLQVDQPLCKSVGKLPNFRPKKNADGTCFKHVIKSGDTCSSMANKYYPLTVANIDTINKNAKTFFWKGCDRLLVNQVICLSDGKRHKPTPNPLSECGPYAPGDWNVDSPPECRNKACCSSWGFCGFTSEFCNSDSCYSNCGYGTLPTVKATSFNRIVYWMDADNEMYYDPMDIDPKYDIVHYSFAKITSNFDISVGYGFEEFLQITAKKKIAIGGWEDSTNPSSYHLFREAVKDANRPTFVKNILKFVNKHNLDGVDFDWEYPEAPDIPNIPAGNKNEGQLYNQLFKDLKAKQKINLSVAIPASPWYLKGFPLTDMDKNMDYFVLMNYDYYGQWDYGKQGIGCHADKRNTTEAIKMIVKSGINTKKLYGGVANYARTYKLQNTGCTTFGCPFTGPESGASAGPITNSPSVMLENELKATGPYKRWTDTDSWCDVLTYNGGTEWAAWMKEGKRNELETWYKDIGLGGSALWSVNYYNEIPVDLPEDYWIDIYFEEAEFLGELHDIEISIEISKTCDKNPQDINIDKESDPVCLYMGMIH